MNNIHKITAIVIPTFIIASPVSALDCYLDSSEVNVSNENLVKIPYKDGFESLVPVPIIAFMIVQEELRFKEKFLII